MGFLGNGKKESAEVPPITQCLIRGNQVSWFQQTLIPCFPESGDQPCRETLKHGIHGSGDQTSAPECRFLRVGWPFPGLLHPGRVIVPDDPLKALLGPFPTLRANTLIQNTRFPCWVTT